ncbi:hypothetical protein FE257_009684 [Aspergillus nanangensis]|uniref:Dipeptidyl peptidase III n=1 Tax=Aspergillus nanangensis TaxID=2582783 RepID=A0AAD4CJS9_ASPNN|nr:hypothetical protein FE257_009684 [Aspergillus nanangensis]
MEPQSAPTHHLLIEDMFNGLTADERFYAYHLSRAAWHGTRVLLRQTSPETSDIFYFIMGLHKCCRGRWLDFVADGVVTEQELSGFLEYAARFLSNIGNYYVDGGGKIIPIVSGHALWRLAKRSDETRILLEKAIKPMLFKNSSGYKYPSDKSQAHYYLGKNQFSADEIALILKAMAAHKVEPENTRIVKSNDGGKQVFDILQALTTIGCTAQWVDFDRDDVLVRVAGGDHREEMSKICGELLRAKEFTSNAKHHQRIDEYINKFLTGNLRAVSEPMEFGLDQPSVIDMAFGFVESYRGRDGARGEWLKKLAKKADTFLRLMPWAMPKVNKGKGPFEEDVFEAPECVSVHVLTCCSSIIWNAINLPSYGDIRQRHDARNVIVANRIRAEDDTNSPCYYVHESEVQRYKQCRNEIHHIATAVREILGHGCGKLLQEKYPGECNFNKNKPPTNPLTGEQITTWYLPGQTWTSVFGKIAREVDECRAEIMSMYLMDNQELLSMFGYGAKTRITADEILYNTYLHIGVQGLQALQFYNAKTQVWCEPRRSGQFAMLKYLLLGGDGVLSIEHDTELSNLTVRVNRDKMRSHGQPALGRLLCRIHIARCTADVGNCREFYEKLSAVDGEYEEWRKVVRGKPKPRWKFVQPNIVLGHGGVPELKVYDETNEGIIQSWVDRQI